MKRFYAVCGDRRKHSGHELQHIIVLSNLVTIIRTKIKLKKKANRRNGGKEIKEKKLKKKEIIGVGNFLALVSHVKLDISIADSDQTRPDSSHLDITLGIAKGGPPDQLSRQMALRLAGS